MTSSVQIIPSISPPLLWEPIRGEVTESFLRSKSSDPNGPTYEDLTVGEDSTLMEALRILGRCVPPSRPNGGETGLVVGYVQSGKTLSFTTVISLARDNGYGVVIVLAGTKENLQVQSEKRLKKDLGIDEGENWFHLSNPNKKAHAVTLDTKLSAWSKNPTRKKAVLITLLKQKDHLSKLAELLECVALDRVPVLIIDDEGDQASLNTKAASNMASGETEQSTIYRRICAVRSALPHHTYLQYTATPQANLLLAQTDLLNPLFAEIITPGPAYTGGRTFFEERQELVIPIPAPEVKGKNSSSGSAPGAPKSLSSALKYFLLASAQHSLTRVKGRDTNRSMMVHPAAQTDAHRVYKKWVERAYAALYDYVTANFEENVEDVLTYFRNEYSSLEKTHPGIHPLPDLVASMVDDVFDDLRIIQVNSTQDAERDVEWKQTRYWVLVGGQKLDRGYTIEGLCVSYMPRALGKAPTADTLQQRARFFGYKRNYIGLCRVFLPSDVKDAFVKYVEHESSVRNALLRTRGEPLREWRREFLLSAQFKPTRQNVIGLGIAREKIGGWVVPSAMHTVQDALVLNRELHSLVVDGWSRQYGEPKTTASFARYGGKNETSPHVLFEPIPLKKVLEDYLCNIQVRDIRDLETHCALLITISAILDKDDAALAEVFILNQTQTPYRTRINGRELLGQDKSGPINQYFSNSKNYINDRALHSNERISLHLRKFNLGTRVNDPSSADILDVPWFAVHVPEQLKTDLLVEKHYHG